MTAIEQAFGTNLANQLLKTYDGSAIVTDTQQDLIGEKYLEEQIKRAHDYQKKNSVIDRYAHLLYEGDKNYKSNARDDIKAYASSSSFANLKPIQQQEFTLQQSKLQPSSSNILGSRSQQASSTNLASLKEQIRILQEEKLALERSQQLREVEESQRAAFEREQNQRALRQGQLEQEQLKQQIEALLAAQQASANTHASSSSFQKLNSQSSAHLKSVTIDAYNDPNFKALLDQITKPLNVPAENVELPAQWPSDGSLGKKKKIFCSYIKK